MAAAVKRGTFVSGYHHYLVAGRVEGRSLTARPTEGRESDAVPDDWNEALYLKLHPDVAAEVRRGDFVSGYQHYLAAGRAEGRESGVEPKSWNEALYRKLHADVAAEVPAARS